MWRNNSNNFLMATDEADLTDEYVVDMLSRIPTRSQRHQRYDASFRPTAETSNYPGMPRLFPQMDSSQQPSSMYPSYSERLNEHSEPHGITLSSQTHYPEAIATSQIEGADPHLSGYHIQQEDDEEWENSQHLYGKENEMILSNSERRRRRRNSDEEAIIKLGRRLAKINMENNKLQRQNAQLERDAETLTQQLRILQRRFGTLPGSTVR